jgi:enoyl-CoA hydratase/carnithine racemase
MTYETIILEKKGGVATMTLNRPEQRNAISPQMCAEIDDVLDQTHADEEVAVLIVTGGTETFCSGMDLKAGRGGSGRRDSTIFSIIEGVAAFEKPTIAAVSGYALGGGLELALACDLRVASDKALFGFPEINFGATAAAGGPQRLPRLIGTANAKQMLFTGERFDAQEAFRMGLVNRVVPVESLIEEASKIGELLASKELRALKLVKRYVDDGMQMDLTASLQYTTTVRVARTTALEEQKSQQ